MFGITSVNIDRKRILGIRNEKYKELIRNTAVTVHPKIMILSFQNMTYDV